MQTKPEFILAVEPTLREEFAQFGDDDVVEFVNLTSKQTGIDGVVFISTVMGQHGPKVKYFTKTGKDQPSFSVSIAANARVVASSLPDRVVARAAPDVIKWVHLNQDALLRFWNDGDTWSFDEVTAFATSLKKLGD